jgi:hypothetical protein
MEGGQERSQEGMHPTTMVDLQCVSFGVEGEPEVEMTEGRGGNGACVSKEEGRGRGSVEGRRVGHAAVQLRPLGVYGASRGWRWLSWAKWAGWLD